MNDFVYAPKCIFYSLKFIYQDSFFIGTKDALYVCPVEKERAAQNETGSIYNQIDGKKADVFLQNLVNKTGVSVDEIHEHFASAIASNNAEGFNNIGYIAFAEAKGIRFNSSWLETSLAVSFKDSFIGDKYMVGGFGKPYKKEIAAFYKTIFAPNKILKAENNFK